MITLRASSRSRSLLCTALLRTAPSRACAVVCALGWGACAPEPSANDTPLGQQDAAHAPDVGLTDGGALDGGATADAGTPTPFTPSPALTAFVPEALGIANTWYDYDEQTHVLTPKPERYGARWGDTAAQVRVLSYYNMDGASGYFSLAVSNWDNGWEPAQMLELEASVKDGWVCVNVQTLSEADCSQPHHLVLRTDRRVVPAAGFSVAEPSLYWVGDRGEGVTVWRAPLDEDVDPFASLELAASALAVPSALRTPSSSVLRGVLNDALGTTHGTFGGAASASSDASATDCGSGCESESEPLLVLQAMADFRVCAWTASSPTMDTLTLSSRCVPLSANPGNQTPLQDGELHEVTLEFGDSAAASYLVAGGVASVQIATGAPAAVVQISDRPEIALWAPDVPFSLFVVRDERGALALSSAPGTLVHLRPGTLQDASALALPAELWN